MICRKTDKILLKNIKISIRIVTSNLKILSLARAKVMHPWRLKFLGDNPYKAALLSHQGREEEKTKPLIKP